MSCIRLGTSGRALGLGVCLASKACQYYSLKVRSTISCEPVFVLNLQEIHDMQISEVKIVSTEKLYFHNFRVNCVPVESNNRK